MKLKVVPTKEIPSAVENAPEENLKQLYILCSAMQDLCIAEQGVGLAAVQVGIPWRVFIGIANTNSPRKFRYFINCDCTPITEELVLSIEGCLSLKRDNGEFRRFEINRYRSIRLKGKELLSDDQLKLVEIDEVHEGFISIVIQHETDHAKNTLISDRGKEIFIRE